MFCLYKLRKPTSDFTAFESELILFYTKISKSKFSFLHAILPESQASQKLESIIDDRIQSNVNIVAKSFSHIVTNAMLFIDVLAFDRFLINGAIELKFFKEMEQKCMALILASLQVKKNKTPYDDLLVKLFENSLRYTKSSDELASYNVIVDTIIHDTLLQRMYLLDMAQMALWSDEIQDRDEQIYMNDLLSSFNLDNYIQNNDNQLHKFILNYKNKQNYNDKNYYTNTDTNYPNLKYSKFGSKNIYNNNGNYSKNFRGNYEKKDLDNFLIENFNTVDAAELTKRQSENRTLQSLLPDISQDLIEDIYSQVSKIYLLFIYTNLTTLLIIIFYS